MKAGEALKLMEQYQRKAVESIIRKETVNDNFINLSYVAVKKDVTQEVFILICFTINGREHKISKEIGYLEYKEMTRNITLGDYARNEAVKTIASLITEGVMRELSVVNGELTFNS